MGAASNVFFNFPKPKIRQAHLPNALTCQLCPDVKAVAGFSFSVWTANGSIYIGYKHFCFQTCSDDTSYKRIHLSRAEPLSGSSQRGTDKRPLMTSLVSVGWSWRLRVRKWNEVMEDWLIISGLRLHELLRAQHTQISNHTVDCWVASWEMQAPGFDKKEKKCME